jgi:dTDP-4-dehydrorhamnose 3,5-epimerase
MKVLSTSFEGVYELIPTVFEDPRGYFFESFKKDALKNEGIDVDWIQENQSFSKKGTVRGLHFQRPPFAQAKLVKVVSGKVLDVIIDIRKDSKTFGKTFSKQLDGEAHHLLLVPVGFAHGFSVLEDAIFQYKVSNPYHKESEGGILWNDPELNIDWMVDQPIVSEKDMILPTFRELMDLNQGGLEWDF